MQTLRAFLGFIVCLTGLGIFAAPFIAVLIEGQLPYTEDQWSGALTCIISGPLIAWLGTIMGEKI